MAGIAEVWFLGADVAVQRDAAAVAAGCELGHVGGEACRMVLLSIADSCVVLASTAETGCIARKE
jgi:hypothetical protein